MNELDELSALETSRRHWPTPPQLAALQRLWEHAQGRTGQCRYTSAFLLGLYHGRRFPFDLTSFRALDEALLSDCLTVLEMDSIRTTAEVHTLLGVPGRRFEELAQHWGHLDVQRLRAESGEFDC